MVERCHAAGIPVEGELGAVGGVEGGALYGEPDPKHYTDINQAKQYVEETGVDFLAIAFGNVHGKYKGEPRLDFERLEAIRDITGIPLVLHGGSGISPADFKRAVSLGISKINFFTGMSQVALETTVRYMATAGEKYNDYVLMIREVKEAVTRIVGQQMDIFGSSGQAN